MKVPTAQESGLGRALLKPAPLTPQTLTVPASAFGGARADALVSLGRGLGGIGDIVAAENARERKRAAAEQAKREREAEIETEVGEEAVTAKYQEIATAFSRLDGADAVAKYGEFADKLPQVTRDGLARLPAAQRAQLTPVFSAGLGAAQERMAAHRKAQLVAQAQGARTAKLDRALRDAIDAKGEARAMGASLALIDDVVARRVQDGGLTHEAALALHRTEEGKLYGGVFESLLARGEAVAAEQFLAHWPDDLLDAEARRKMEDSLRPALERENAADAVAEILRTAPDHPAALGQARAIENREVKALALEALAARNDLQERERFDARAKNLAQAHAAIANSGGALDGIAETLWQQLDEKEAKRLRAYAAALRKGKPIETDWKHYYSLFDLPPEKFALLDLYDNSAKLNGSELTLLAKRQQQTRAALASGAPLAQGGPPGSLDAQLAAVAAGKGWRNAADAGKRGQFEREVRAEIAEAEQASGAKPLTIAERRKLIAEAAAQVPGVNVKVDDTIDGGAGNDTLRDREDEPSEDFDLVDETGRVVLGAGRDAFVATLDAFDGVAAWIGKTTGLADFEADVYESLDLETPDWERKFSELIPEVAEPDTAEGKLARGALSFVLEFIPMARAAKLAGVAEKTEKAARALGVGNRAAKVIGVGAGGEVAATAAEQVLLDPLEGNLLNMLNEFEGTSEFVRAVTDYLAVKEGDGETLARAKTAVEGIVTGALAAPFLLALDAVKAARRAKGALAKGKSTEQGAVAARSADEIGDKASRETERTNTGSLDDSHSSAKRKPDPKLVKNVFDVALQQASKNPTSGKRITIEPSMFGEKADLSSVIVGFVQAHVKKLRKAIGREVALRLPDVPVSNKAIEKAAAEGLGISKYSHVLQTDGIGHAFNRHGIGNEKNLNQMPITAEDFALLPDILSNPDNVEIRLRPKKGAPTMQYKKRTNGSITVIEIITSRERGRNELVLLDMWKKGGSQP